MKLMEVARRFYQYRDHFEVISVKFFQSIGFYCVVVRVKCEVEWNSIKILLLRRL